MRYAFSRLTTDNRNSSREGLPLAPPYADVHDALRAENDRALRPAALWGAFHGLFGIASNELVVVTYGDVAGVDKAIAGVPGVVAVETLQLEPTVRPTVHEPRRREGLYVFRFFDVAHKDVDEIAALSFEAWKDFENADAYDAVPQGLFRQHDVGAANGRMLLCTWYDGLQSWQTSRTPPGRAAEHFGKRHRLTRGTIAYATRLLP